MIWHTINHTSQHSSIPCMARWTNKKCNENPYRGNIVQQLDWWVESCCWPRPPSSPSDLLCMPALPSHSFSLESMRCLHFSDWLLFLKRIKHEIRSIPTRKGLQSITWTCVAVPPLTLGSPVFIVEEGLKTSQLRMLFRIDFLWGFRHEQGDRLHLLRKVKNNRK